MRVSAIYRFVTHKFSGQEKTPETISFRGLSGEAQTGFEPVNQGVADPRLTAWLLRHILNFITASNAFCKMTPTGIEPVLPP